MRQYHLYIFDLDGTLYRGSEALPYAVQMLEMLREDGAEVRFLTNNSGMTAADQAAKLNSMGFSAAPREVVTSTMVAARYAQEQGIDSVFAIGEVGMGLALEESGVRCVNLNGNRLDQETLRPAGAVLAGICRGLTYHWIASGMRRIHSGALFLAANRDETYPVERGLVLPGSGATVGALVGCTGKEPTVVGKPEPSGILQILEETQTSPVDTLVVGDRYETDVVAARRAGCDSALVLTGVSREPVDGVRCITDLRELIGYEP